MTKLPLSFWAKAKKITGVMLVGVLCIHTSFAALLDASTIEEKTRGKLLRTSEFNLMANILEKIIVDDQETSGDTADDFLGVGIKISATEILNNGEFPDATNWGTPDDFDLSGTAAYSHSDNSGTLSQVSGNFASTPTVSQWYSLTYTVSGLSATGTPIVKITTDFAETETTLPLTNGSTHTVYFKAASSITAFTLAVTSVDTDDDFILDTLTLKQVNDGSNMLLGDLDATGTVTATSFVGDGSGLTLESSGIDHDATTNFVANEHIDWTGDAGPSNLHVNNITAVPESAVTAHEAALSITESQISDLSHAVDVVSNIAQDTILGRVTTGSGNSEELTATQVRTLLNVEDGATANMSDTEIKTAYENNADTNAFTDAEQTKVGHISVTQAVDLDQMESDIAALDQAVVLQGTWDASVGTFPGSGSAQSGYSYIVSTGGTVNGEVFTANDRIVAITDNASTTTYASNWHKLDYTDQVLSVAGKTGAVTLVEADITDLQSYITATLTQEEVEDYAGGLVSENTETLITVTYEVSDNTLDFVVDNDLSKYSNATSGFITGNESITLSGDVTGSGTTSIATTIAAGSVDLAMLSATGSASSSTYLRGDNTWATISGGDVSAAANITDLALVRGHGGTKGIQDSGIIIDNSDNLSGVGDITGIAGGITFYGGTGAGDELDIRSTSHATRGVIKFHDDLYIDQANGQVGVGVLPSTLTNSEELNVAGRIAFEQATSPLAASGYGKIYMKSDGDLYFMNGSGTETNIIDDLGGGDPDQTLASVLTEGFTANDTQYIAIDKIQARDGDGLSLFDDGGVGIFVKDGGNVGIGTATPTTALEIKAYSEDNTRFSQDSQWVYTELAQESYAASAGLMWNAYRVPEVSQVIGSLLTEGNTKYKKDDGGYDRGAAGIFTVLNSQASDSDGGQIYIATAPSATAADANITWNIAGKFADNEIVLTSEKIELSGNVGIGTNSPKSILTVKGTAFSTSHTSSTGIFIDNSGITAGAGNVSAPIEFSVLGGELTAKKAAIVAVQEDSDVDSLGLAFYTSPSDTRTDPIEEALRISREGNVGIGTTSPGGTLDVVGETFTSGGTDDFTLQITNTLNDSSSAGGSDVYRGLKINITETDTTGWDNVYLADLQVGGSSKFLVDDSGAISSAGAAATGTSAVALGDSNDSSGNFSFTAGLGSSATGTASVAVGSSATASANYAMAMGDNTTASGHTATAMGFNTTASGTYSTALGSYTAAEAMNSVAIGRYNIAGGTTTTWIDNEPLYEVGIGSSVNDKQNALTILKNGETIVANMQRETLTQNDFTTSTNWGIANGVSIVSQKAEYNHHASGGTLTQTEANFSDVTGSDNNPATGDILYIFKYTVASVTDTNNDLSLRITTGFAEEVVPLNVTAGSYTAYFKANSDPGSFVLEVEASGSDNGDTFTLDDLSLKPLESGKLVVGGETVLDGSLEMPHGSAPTIDAEGEIAIDSTNTTASDLVYYSGGEAQVLNPLQVKTVVVAQPADTDQILLMRAPYDLTIQNIHGINDPQDAAGETVLFRIFETESDGDYDIPAAGSDGKDIDAVTSDDVGVDATPTGTDGKVTAGNWIGIYVETVTNTVDFLTVTFEYTKDRE